MQASSIDTSTRPTLMPGAQRDVRGWRASLPRSAANAVRELATVLMRMPNQATP